MIVFKGWIACNVNLSFTNVFLLVKSTKPQNVMISPRHCLHLTLNDPPKFL